MQGIFSDHKGQWPVLISPERRGRLMVRLFSGKEFVWEKEALIEQYENGKLFLYHRKQAGASLVLENPEHIRDLQAWMKGKYKSASFVPLIGFLLFCLLMFFILWWYALPPLASAVAMRMPVSVDKTLGDATERSLIYNYPVDSAKTKEMYAFVHTLFPDENQWKVLVVHSEEVNAFALPNGTLVVFSGLLSKLTSGEELAALLGHETAHVRFRHSTQALAREWAGTFLLFVVSGNSPHVWLTAGADLRNLSFSREAETRCDAYAVELLVKKGLPVSGMVRLCEVLQKSGSRAIPEWTSTHPDTERRLQAAKEAEAGSMGRKDILLTQKLSEMLKRMK